MVLKIKLGKERKIDDNGFSTKEQIKVIKRSVPNFKCQAHKMTEV